MKMPAVAIFAVLGLISPSPGATGSQENLYVEAGILTSVIIRVPAESAVKPPLLVVLHGRGDTAANMAGMWNVLDDPKPILAVLEAPYPMLLNGDKGARLGESWEPLSRDEKFREQAAPKTAKYIVDTIRAVQKRYATGGVYLLGHSQGVSYAYRVALQEPDLVRGVMALAGYLDPERLPAELFSRAAGKINIFIGHGKTDPQVDPEVSRAAKAFLVERGFKVVLDEFDGGHSMSSDVVRRAQAWMMALERTTKRPIA
jgi:phospholipase/carboxylesterase